MIRILQKGNFNRTEHWLNRLVRGDEFKALDSLAEIGVNALASATPKRSGLTASSWTYRINKGSTYYEIEWYNTNDRDGKFNVAIGLQYGHGTGTGGYVRGFDYINPSIKPVFNSISSAVWMGVTNV